jgi:RNA polymerase sigma-70 factor (ECF subfamily)
MPGGGAQEDRARRVDRPDADRHGGDRGTSAAGQRRGRPLVYCLVPRDLAPKLHDALRRHFSDDPAVEVIVERRARERRATGDRRAQRDGAAPSERRLIRAAHGRRAGERRLALGASPAPPLPRKARPYAGRLAFVARLEPSSQRQEDLDTARLVTRIQGGDIEAFGLLYMRYFDRIYNYVRVILNDPTEAEDAAQQIFIDVLDSLPGYRDHGGSFRAWLFRVARNHALNELRRLHRVEAVDPREAERRFEERQDDDGDGEPLSLLDWISDRELYMFVQRLPLAQRQVLVLRYVLDLSADETARVLGRSTETVRQQQSRAVSFLRARLVAVGRDPKGRGDRIRSSPLVPQSYVLRARRFSLIAPGPTR